MCILVEEQRVLNGTETVTWMFKAATDHNSGVANLLVRYGALQELHWECLIVGNLVQRFLFWRIRSCEPPRTGTSPANFLAAGRIVVTIRSQGTLQRGLCFSSTREKISLARHWSIPLTWMISATSKCISRCKFLNKNLVRAGKRVRRFNSG
jgi:hypothetical protein